jgi:hypothetical protein
MSPADQVLLAKDIDANWEQMSPASKNAAGWMFVEMLDQLIEEREAEIRANRSWLGAVGLEFLEQYDNIRPADMPKIAGLLAKTLEAVKRDRTESTGQNKATVTVDAIELAAPTVREGDESHEDWGSAIKRLNERARKIYKGEK